MKRIFFSILGIIALVNQIFGLLVISILLMIITKSFITISIIYLTYILSDMWRDKYFKKNGYKPNIGTYKK